GVAVDQPGRNGKRRRFGNMILSRLPVRQVYRHFLPYPCEPGVAGMPRIAIEAVVGAPFGDVRVITTHLEYYSKVQRMAQVNGLRQVYADGHAHARDAAITKDDGSPFQTFLRPRPTIITGDFNFEPDWPEHPQILAPFDPPTPPSRPAYPAVGGRVAAPASGRAASIDVLHLPEDRSFWRRVALRLHFRQRRPRPARARARRRPANAGIRPPAGHPDAGIG